MTGTGAMKAWEFLKRNPGYKEAAAAVGAASAPAEPAPFPMRVRTEADLAASAWGLLAWEDPSAGDDPASGTSVSPFWRYAPMLAAVPARGAPSLAEVLDAPGWRLSGLRLADGGAVVKVEHGGAAVQLLIEEGFDPADGIEVREVRLPVAPALRTPLLEAAALWPPIEAAPKKAAGASPTPSCWRCSTAGSPAKACARSPPPSTARRGSRPSGPPTASFARGCAGG